MDTYLLDRLTKFGGASTKWWRLISSKKRNKFPTLIGRQEFSMHRLPSADLARLSSRSEHDSTFQFGTFARAYCMLIALAFLAAGSAQPAFSQSSTSRFVNPNWPKAEEATKNYDGLDRKYRSRSGYEKRRLDAAELAKIKIPVCIPEKLFSYDTIVLRAVEGGDQYFVNATSPGVTVIVVGTHIVHDVPDQSPAAKQFYNRAAKYTITRTESGLNLGLSRYGIPYTITLECQRQKDPRCAQENEIRALADSMIYVGGTR